MAEDMKAVAAVITTLAGKPMYGQRVKKKSNLLPGLTTKGTAKGAKDTAEGAKGRGIDWQIKHLECPSCVVPGSPMPAFKALGADNLKKLATFLEASKGAK